MLLHSLFAVVDVFSVAAGHGVQADELLNGGALGIQAVGYDGTAEIAVRNHAQKLARLLIDHHGDRAHVVLTHGPGHMLGSIAWDTTHRVRAHDFSDLHWNASQSMFVSQV